MGTSAARGKYNIRSKYLTKEANYVFFQLGKLLPDIDPQRILSYLHDPNPKYSTEIDIADLS